MRSSLLIAIVLAACGTTSSTDSNKPAFEITSADLTLSPGEETTQCFYFHTPNTTALAVHKWVSDLTPGSHHMIFYQTLGGTPPADGTVDDCSNIRGGGMSVPLPVYLTQIPHQEADFPSDDGTGHPLAQVIQPNTAGFFQMHYLNTTDQTLTVHVYLAAYALPDKVGYVHTDPFVTYNADIAIPPHAVNYQVTATCPSAAQTAELAQLQSYTFWSMTTHSHKQTVEALIKDGSDMVVDTTDWEHPTVMQWGKPFYQFQSGVTWQCTYTNNGSNANNTIYSGNSAATNEMCMGGGYYFPSAGPRGCFMSGGTCNCFL
jgi:hypothetical protein